MGLKQAVLIVTTLLTTMAHSQDQNINNGSFNIQVQGNKNFLFNFSYDQNYEALKHFFNHTNAMYDQKRKEDMARLQRDITTFLVLQQAYFDSVMQAQKNTNGSIGGLNDKMNRMREEVKKAAFINENNFATVLAEIRTVNEHTFSILDALRKMNDKLDVLVYNKKRLKKARHDAAAKKFRSGDLSLYTAFFLRTGVNAWQLKLNNVKIASEPGFICQAGGMLSRYRYKKHINLHIIPSITYSTAHTSYNNIRYASQTFVFLELQAGLNYHTNLNKGKWLSDLVIPFNIAGGYNMYHNYKNHLPNYNPAVFNIKNESTDMNRVRPLMAGVSTGVWLQLLNRKRGGFIIGPSCTYYLTDYYKKSYRDDMGNYPYTELTSRLYNITITIGYIFN